MSVFERFKQEVFALSVTDKFLEMITLESQQILYFKIAIAQYVLDNKVVLFAIIYEAIFFAGAKNVKR